jgi:cellobiose phosphorylase
VSILLESLSKIANAIQLPVEMLGSKDSVDDQFVEMIDDLVMMSESDSELAEGLKWIDLQSQRNGLTFYEMAMIILRKHMVERRAKDWLIDKINQ